MNTEPTATADTNARHRGRVRVEPSAKRVRAYVDGEVVADTIHPLLVWEVPYYPTYYIPVDDVRAKLVATGATDRSPSLGTAEIFDVVTGSASAPGAARRYTESPLEELRGRGAPRLGRDGRVAGGGRADLHPRA